MIDMWLTIIVSLSILVGISIGRSWGEPVKLAETKCTAPATSASR